MRNEKLKSSGARAFLRIACLSAVLPGGLLLASAADLPDGPGKAETTRLCGKCHSLDQATSLRQGMPAWQETIAKMVNLGAEGSESEITATLNYLVKNFGSATPTPATAGAAA